MEIEEIQEEQEQEPHQILTSNSKPKSWFKWVGPTVRKAMIASLAAVAAPIVIPPVIFLTTVGGVLCVPFGVYLGTVTLTDELMSYLFPAKLGFDLNEHSLSFELQSEDGEGNEDYQMVYNEQEAEQQIEIIREIIGYKSPKQPSIVQELHAILHSIGIEPSLSLKEHTKLNEISCTIRLLKSLIGVE